jgi:sugar phosphate isomerase/epimerase
VLGLKYVVCPGIFEENKLTPKRYRQVAETLQIAGEKLAEDGFQLAYHNHAFEFESFDGRTGFEILIKETGPEAVKFEVDTYWVDEGGHDVGKFIRGLGKRCPLLHLKDRAKDGTFAEVGSGTLDFGAILGVAQEIGVDACMVEQDSCPRDPFDCIETSLKFLRQKGIA